MDWFVLLPAWMFYIMLGLFAVWSVVVTLLFFLNYRLIVELRVMISEMIEEEKQEREAMQNDDPPPNLILLDSDYQGY